MPSIALLAAAYAAYSQHEKHKASKYDDNINLDGKSSVTLMPVEELELFQFPICTLTFCCGDYINVVSSLKQKVSSILACNPWLGGWMIRDSNDDYKIKIFYDAFGVDHCGGIFELFEPLAPIPLTDSTLHHEKDTARSYEDILVENNVIVSMQSDLVGRDRPLWKIGIVPCSLTPHDRFALVVSISHTVADAHTFYEIFKMLGQDAQVKSLDPKRLPNYKEALTEMAGTGVELEALARLMKRPILDFDYSCDDPVVLKTFYVNEDWVLARKNIDPNVHADANSVVSMNSILTSWWFQTNNANVGFMAVNLRHRLDNFPLDNSHAGNYISLISFLPHDYRTPGLIQNSLHRLRRCGAADSGLLSVHENRPFSWNMKCSFSNDWSKFFRCKFCFHEKVTVLLHLPLFPSRIVASLPSTFSSLHLFTAHPGSIDGSERRFGATVLCRQSAWTIVTKSGIVEELMMDF